MAIGVFEMIAMNLSQPLNDNHAKKGKIASNYNGMGNKLGISATSAVSNKIFVFSNMARQSS